MRTVVVFDNLASFVRNDIRILEKMGEVRELHYTGKRDLPSLGSSIAMSNLVYCWFVLGYATTSALLSRILRKRSIAVAGGWDVIHLPEIDYGAMKSEKRIRRTKYALRNTDRIIAVSESTREEVLQWVDRDVDVIYNVVDTERFKPGGEKENLVVTVGAIDNLTRYRKKGIETFLGAAAKLPDIDFVIIGKNSPELDQKLREKAPKNVTIAGRVSDAELLSLYQRAKVYAQISYHESFGVALAEAMSCNAIPVVTKRSALPEVVGDTGFYADYGDVPETVEAIQKGLESDTGSQCRRRVQKKFSFQEREQRLLGVMSEELSR